MMDYIKGTVISHPYENAQELVKWIATYYSIDKDVGTIRKIVGKIYLKIAMHPEKKGLLLISCN